RQPELLAVHAHVAHVRAAGVGNRPGGHDGARGEVDHGHAALADAGLAADPRESAVRHVELAAVAARIEPVRADARLDEAYALERVTVDEVHAAGAEVGHVKDRAVRADADVLRDALVGQREVAKHLAAAPVDLREPAGVLAGHDEVAAVDRVVAVVDTATVR